VCKFVEIKKGKEMKIVATNKVREILEKQYSQLKHIWVFDKKLILLPGEQAKEILISIAPQKIAFVMALLKATEIKDSEENKKKQLAEILKKADAYNQPFKDQLFDCDDYGLVANAFVKLKVAELNFSYNWAFGECSLINSNGDVHNQNIFITENLEVRLFEPQANQIILPRKGETVFYVRM